MTKTKPITIPPSPTASHTIAHPAVVTVHLINQSPSAELVGGVTLYFEPVGTASIELITTPTVDAHYSEAVAQGIQNGLDKHLNGTLTGLRIWWCDWLYHPVDSSPRAFTRAAEIATMQILEQIPAIEFTSETNASQTSTTFLETIFEQQPINPGKVLPLQPPTASRWTIKTPLISHITWVRGTSLFSLDRTIQNRFIEAQATLSFKAIASTQRPCPIDKLPEFYRENEAILIAFADNIHSQIPNARGFDVMVKELSYQADDGIWFNPQASRRESCLAILTAALQQAINVRGHVIRAVLP